MLHRYRSNVGIAVAWFEIHDAAFAQHTTALFLEDDVVLSPHGVTIVGSLLSRYAADQTVYSVDVNYLLKNASKVVAGACSGVDAVERWTLGHDWAVASWRDRWRKARPSMLEYLALVPGDYQFAKTAPIMAWHRRFGHASSVHSQDQARQLSFLRAGYCGKVRPVMRRALPIGRQGVHFSSQSFDKWGLNDVGDDYIVPSDYASVPERWRECEASVAGIARNFNTSLDGRTLSCGDAVAQLNTANFNQRARADAGATARAHAKPVSTRQMPQMVQNTGTFASQTTPQSQHDRQSSRREQKRAAGFHS